MPNMLVEFELTWNDPILFAVVKQPHMHGVTTTSYIDELTSTNRSSSEGHNEGSRAAQHMSLSSPSVTLDDPCFTY